MILTLLKCQNALLCAPTYDPLQLLIPPCFYNIKITLNIQFRKQQCFFLNFQTYSSLILNITFRYRQKTVNMSSYLELLTLGVEGTRPAD